MPTNINLGKKLGIPGQTNIQLPSGPVGDFSTKSLSFDGKDNYVSIGRVDYSEVFFNGDDEFSFGDGTTDSPFSISAWVKMTDATEFTILNKFNTVVRNNFTDSYEYFFRTDGNDKICFNLYDKSSSATDKIGRQYSTALTSFQGSWIHLVATYDGSGSSTGLKIYLNGNRVDDTDDNSGSYIAMKPTEAPLEIGRHEFKQVTTYANGLMDEISIFNIELSLPNVTLIYNNGKPANLTSLNPLAWYRMGENSTFESPQILMPENSNKDKISKYSFDFRDGFKYFSTGSVFNVLDGASQVTISFWTNISTSASEVTACYLPLTTTQRVIECALRSDGSVRFYVQNSSGTTYRADSALNIITDDSWFHIMVTLDMTQPVGSKAKIFINGQDQTLTDTIDMTSLEIATDELVIGRNKLFGSSYGRPLLGKLTQFAIWNNSNLQSQASAIYNSGTPTDISSLSPTVYYTLGGDSSVIFNTIWKVNDSANSGFTLTGSFDFKRNRDRVGDAPNSKNNALSSNMQEADIVEDAPS